MMRGAAVLTIVWSSDSSKSVRRSPVITLANAKPSKRRSRSTEAWFCFKWDTCTLMKCLSAEKLDPGKEMPSVACFPCHDLPCIKRLHILLNIIKLFLQRNNYLDNRKIISPCQAFNPNNSDKKLNEIKFLLSPNSVSIQV